MNFQEMGMAIITLLVLGVGGIAALCFLFIMKIATSSQSKHQTTRMKHRPSRRYQRPYCDEPDDAA